MAIKSKVKQKVKVKAQKKTTGKSKSASVKAKTLKKKTMSKPVMKTPKKIFKTGKTEKPTRKLMTKSIVVKEKPVITSIAKPESVVETPPAVKIKPAVMSKAAIVKRIINPLAQRRPIKRSQRANQFAYMKAPGVEHDFEVTDTVEVFCDHEKNRERIRGWVKGIVVQVDHKMAAVQFRSNVYLTDGWMVPDRILWYPVNSEHIRPVPGKKPVKKDFIPDY